MAGMKNSSKKKYVSNRRKKSLWFLLGTRSFPLPGMKYPLKNTFALYGKTASCGKKIGNGFH